MPPNFILGLGVPLLCLRTQAFDPGLYFISSSAVLQRCGLRGHADG